MRLRIFSIAALSIVCVAPARAQIGNSDLIAQAKKEGRVVWYTTVSIPESQEFAALFKTQISSINVDIIRTGSSALVNRLISEHNAKKYLADVLQGFSSSRRIRSAQAKGNSRPVRIAKKYAQEVSPARPEGPSRLLGLPVPEHFCAGLQHTYGQTA